MLSPGTHVIQQGVTVSAKHFFLLFGKIIHYSLWSHRPWLSE